MLELFARGDDQACLAVKTYIFAYSNATDPKTGESRDAETIKRNVDKTPKAFDTLVQYVVQHIKLFIDLPYDELMQISVEQIVIPEIEISGYFNQCVQATKDRYIKEGLFQDLKGAVDGGKDSFGMWIFEAENQGRVRLLFDTEPYLNKDLIGLSFDETIDYFYLIASKAVENS